MKWIYYTSGRQVSFEIDKRFPLSVLQHFLKHPFFENKHLDAEVGESGCGFHNAAGQPGGALREFPHVDVASSFT